MRAGQLAAVNLRLPGDGRVGARFDDQLAAMVAARDEGLIAGTGSVAHLRENLAAGDVTLDDEALRDLDGVAA